ncbi:hypothetical protein J2Z31_001763 [Sinorhizobium kostiense]|uniref:Uncharacterized protein n=1 Tax=Sinorhizobium kostiense TaxID=76747 RepID=A0ABS4QYP1_9HYPH|nr:hypothetical protein [Sinorhizobium kostiense]MBP2235271.1 hypothetical protein [Sinorhizobium kostiense]
MKVAIPALAPYWRAFLLIARFRADDGSRCPQKANFVVERVVGKKVKKLPPGTLAAGNFPTLTQAQGAAGPTSLVAGTEGQGVAVHAWSEGWLYAGRNKIVEIGPPEWTDVDRLFC